MGRGDTQLNAGRLRALLSYDPETGDFVRNVGVRGQKANTKAGSLHRQSGYFIIGVDQKSYRAHRLAWLYMTGKWPKEVDHINGDRSDNRWSNLREATRSQNNANMNRRRDNLSGSKGVSWDKRNNKWRAYIVLKGRQEHLGRFVSLEEASNAYRIAAKKYYGEYARV